MEFVAENNSLPKTVFVFARKLKIKEEDFYTEFASISALEKAIWLDFLLQTTQSITKEEVWPGYSVQEKMLAFYFTLLENLKSQRSYVKFTYLRKRKTDLRPYFLEDFKREHKDFVNDLLLEGKESGEIADRNFISNAYPSLFWVQLLTILRFWVNDESQAFELTDAFVEKSVNFSFDLLGKSGIDSAFDYFKFVWQNRKHSY